MTVTDLLKAKLIASTISRRQYLTLRNTVRVLRLSGAPLEPEQEKKVREFEAVISAFNNKNGSTEATN
jgi:hypothetical protein